MGDLTWTEIDGVPAVWAPVPGPLRATLLFRVGEVDETAPWHGVTHLVEHLALHGMHDRRYSFNGCTELLRTLFYCSGDEADVVDFLGSVCARLADLPDDRIAVERGVLRAEDAGRGPQYRDRMLYMRYGAQRHGIPGVDQFGLGWLDADAVRRWSAERFTRGNAALWLSGPPPAGLRLPLPDGPRYEPVPAVPEEQVVPGAFWDRSSGVGVSAVYPRTTAGVTAPSIVADELTRRLRHELGLTYSVQALGESLDNDTAHVTFSADADPARHPELRDEVVAVLARLAAEGPPAEVLDRVRASSRQDEDELRLVALDRAATGELTGRPAEPVEVVQAERAALTAEEAHAALRDLAATVLLMVPADVELPEEYPPVPVWSGDTVDGNTMMPAAYHPTTGPPEEVLVCGPEGVSLVRLGGRAVTVRWRDTVLAGRWASGATLLVAKDGFSMTVVPDAWSGGPAVVAWVDAAAPPWTRVPLAGDGPSVPPPAPPPAPQYDGGHLATMAPWAGLVLGLLFCLIALEGPEPATTTREAITPGDIRDMWIMGLVALAVSVAFLLRRAYRRHRGGQSERGSVPS